jgi:hypothetical protein
MRVVENSKLLESGSVLESVSVGLSSFTCLL